MTSFYYSSQNPWVCCFLVQIKAFVLLSSAELVNLNNKAKTKWILVVGVKYCHREIVLLSVNVFGRKEQIEDTIFTSRTRDRPAILRRHPSEAKSSCLQDKGCRGSMFSYSNTLSIGPGIEFAIARPSVKCSNTWTSPAAARQTWSRRFALSWLIPELSFLERGPTGIKNQVR